MRLKLFRPKFWNQKKPSLLSIILLLITGLYIFLFHFKKIITKEKKFKIKTICIGNIYLGGTGKTPLTIKIAEVLDKQGIKSVIIKKYRKEHNDEIKLINKYFKQFLYLDTRVQSLNRAILENYKVAVLDDGLQDFSFKKDIKIICFNSNSGLGNRMQIPSGPLRQSMQSIKDANFIVINGNRNLELENNLKKLEVREEQIFYSKYEITNIGNFKRKEFLVFSGIGNNESFFNLLKENEIKFLKKLSYPDHYEYSKTDIEQIKKIAVLKRLEILTTEKDYLRIKEDLRNNINFVSINLKIDDQDNFFNSIKKIYEKC